MDGHPRSPMLKEPIPKNALITPSASPPISRSYNSSWSRKLDTASPAKRPRLASVFSSTPAPSLPSQEPGFDLDDARRTSSQRVVNLWSQLAEKYTRRLDEDDIIDFRVDDIIRDRGILRASQDYDFGCFGDAPNDVGSEGGDQDAEDDVDELDAFAPEANISDEIRMKRGNMPPKRAMSPAFAEDLKEFLELERRRKEESGVEEDEESSEVDLRALYDEEWEETSSVEDRGEDDDGSTVSHSDDETDYVVPTQADDESEDELGIWDVDEGSTVYQISQELKDEDEDDIKIVEPPSAARSPSPVHESTPPIPSSSQTKSKKQSTPRYKSKLPTRKKSPVQLHTPPQSSSSVFDSSTPDDIFSSITRKLTPSPSKPRPKPKPAYQGTKAAALRDVSPPRQSELSEYSPTRPRTRSTGVNSPDHQFSPTTVKVSPKKPKLKPEVVITRRRPTTPFRPAEESDVPETPPPQVSPEPPYGLGVTPTPEKELSLEQESDDPVGLDESPDPQRLSMKQKGKGKAKEKQKTTGNSQDKQAKSKKRKRVASLPSEELEEEDELQILGSSSSAILDKQFEETTHSPGLPTKSVPERRGRRLSTGSTSGVSNDESGKLLPLHKRCPILTHTEGPETNTRVRESSRHRSQTHRFADHELHEQHRYSQPPYTPQYNRHNTPFTAPPPNFAPINDPQTQFYIAQAVQHLAYLMNPAQLPPGGWPGHHPASFPSPFSNPHWSPYTPPSHRAQSSHPPITGLSYSTPTHQHPYPHSFTPSLSHTTLPPSSPEVPSPPTRPTSLVRRSKSRGRRVSFKLDDDHIEDESPTRELGKSKKGKKIRSPSPSLKKGKGKQPDPEPDGDAPEAQAGRRVGRAQTPGPPSRSASSERPNSRGRPTSRHDRTL
jgi:hypothetical protein